MRRPEDASMRSSRSTKRHASWRARSVPTVVLPEPINPARQTMEERGATPRGTGFCVTMQARTRLIALQNANCTTEGRELDLGEARADATEKALHILGSDVASTVRIGLEERFGAVVHGAQIRLGIQVERICAREADFYDAFAALHGVEAGAEEVAVIKNVAGSGHDVDVVQSGLKNLRVSADGGKFKFAC